MKPIDEKTFSTGHILELSTKYRMDKQLVQKQIASLALVFQLRNSGLDFIFKGGTSLLCLIKPPVRLSLDVDIVVTGGTNIYPFLNFAVQHFPFTRFEEDVRTSPGRIPKSHFRFYFNSFLNEQTEENIVLDILYEENVYTKVAFSEIPSDFIVTVDAPLTVVTPTIDAILGDKLTAFAPNTTGIPFKRGERDMSMEIIKQLYDIGQLFDRCEDISIIRSTFFEICKKEIEYRNLDTITNLDVLDDIFSISLKIVGRDGDDPVFLELLTGINRLKSYIINRRFHLDYAVTVGGKAAYLSRLLYFNSSEIQHFSSPQANFGMAFTEPEYLRFNKLRKSNPEAFFYWYQALNLK